MTQIVDLLKYHSIPHAGVMKFFANALICAALALSVSATAQPPSAAERRDGQHDFDFEIGVWKTHLKRLVHPLSGSTSWVELDGTTVVRKVWNGRANLAELETDAASGHLEVLSLRLYDPQSRQWSLNTANVKSGTLSVATI